MIVRNNKQYCCLARLFSLKGDRAGSELRSARRQCELLNFPKGVTDYFFKELSRANVETDYLSRVLQCDIQEIFKYHHTLTNKKKRKEK